MIIPNIWENSKNGNQLPPTSQWLPGSLPAHLGNLGIKISPKFRIHFHLDFLFELAIDGQFIGMILPRCEPSRRDVKRCFCLSVFWSGHTTRFAEVNTHIFSHRKTSHTQSYPYFHAIIQLPKGLISYQIVSSHRLFGVFLKWGTPKSRVCTNLKWMITRGTPISGNLRFHMYIKIIYLSLPTQKQVLCQFHGQSLGHKKIGSFARYMLYCSHLQPIIVKKAQGWETTDAVRFAGHGLYFFHW